MADDSQPLTPASNESETTAESAATRPTGSTAPVASQNGDSPFMPQHFNLSTYLTSYLARSRANSTTSVHSMLGPPSSQRSIIQSTARLDLNAVNEGLIGQPTVAPDNTPANMTPTSQYRGAPSLPTIHEALERLPDFAYVSSHITSVASTHAEVGDDDQDGGVPLRSSPKASHASSDADDEDCGTSIDDYSVSGSIRSQMSYPTGVPEHTDWQEDVEADLDMALARLANLAEDDHKKDAGRTVEAHYTRRLNAALYRQNMQYTYFETSRTMLASLMERVAKAESMLEMVEEKLTGDDELLARIRVTLGKQQ